MKPLQKSSCVQVAVGGTVLGVIRSQRSFFKEAEILLTETLEKWSGYNEVQNFPDSS